MSNSNAIVIDNCSEFSRAGFAGDETPRAVFPSVVGRPLVPTDETKQIFVGDQALLKKAVLRIKHPVDHGIITNWEDMEHVRKLSMCLMSCFCIYVARSGTIHSIMNSM